MLNANFVGQLFAFIGSETFESARSIRLFYPWTA